MSPIYKICKIEASEKDKTVEISDEDFTLIIEALAEIRDRKIPLSSPPQDLIKKLKTVF